MNCKLCGAKNISPSFGGPDICGACDCGSPPIAQLQIYIQSLTAENKRLREALLKADHPCHCGVWSDNNPTCTCGISEALSRSPEIGKPKFCKCTSSSVGHIKACYEGFAGEAKPAATAEDTTQFSPTEELKDRVIEAARTFVIAESTCSEPDRIKSICDLEECIESLDSALSGGKGEEGR